MSAILSSRVALFLAACSSSSAVADSFFLPTHGWRATTKLSSALSSSENYLSSLSSGDTATLDLSSLSRTGAATMEPPPLTDFTNNWSNQEDESVTKFSHAPLSYFALHKLTPKGPRKNADVGQPHDSTRKLVSVGPTSAGSWWCAAGGWPSPALRATTEVFFVLAGHGCVTDLDGTRHEFKRGDTVVLPKGWSGRWDILQDIHKVWLVHDHPNIEETSNPIRAVVAPHHSLVASYENLAPAKMSPSSTALGTIYNVGPTKVEYWTGNTGSDPIAHQAGTQFFHVLEGVFFLTNADGCARRCVAGDTAVLPKGWTGYLDVVEPVRNLWVMVD